MKPQSAMAGDALDLVRIEVVRRGEHAMAQNQLERPACEGISRNVRIIENGYHL
jgi:hypothetical protein